MYRLFILLFFISPSFCRLGLLSHDIYGKEPGIRQIVGTEEASVGQVQYTVAVFVNKEAQCSGSIIDSLHIITAAHCFFNKTKEIQFRAKSASIVAGVRNLNERSKMSKVEKISIPKEYLDHRQGDIAVLRLRRKLDLGTNRNLQALKLPTVKKSYDEQWAVASGFGDNQVDVEYDDYEGDYIEAGTFDGKLRYVDAEVLSNEMCNESPKLLCARAKQNINYNYTGICSGDSGGPLVIDDDTLIGTVVSSPFLCDESKDASLYTNVTTYLDFLHKALKDQRDSEIITYELYPRRS